MKLKNYLIIATLFVANNCIVLWRSALSFASLFFIHTIKSERILVLNALKKPVFLKASFMLLMLLLSEVSYTQTYKPFTIRKKIDIRGSMVVAGNNILGKDNLPFNDNTKSNQDISMKYIDIDSDASTFSSSSADLSVPTQINGTLSTCYKVSYAALYWGAMLQSGSRTEINKVKLKLPGASTYSDINGTLIYDANSSPIIPDANKPYACYADVTSLLSGLSSAGGTYTVANVIASEGSNGSTGLSAGWTLFVVYEDPSLHMKSFNVFDGFSHIYDSHFEKIPVTGFITPPSGPVDLQFAYAALDGDKPKGGTKLEFGTKEVTTPLRSANKFFNSTIENTNGVQTLRNPSGSNTLGYDTGVLEVEGANPEYIKNNQTSTDFTLQVAKGQADPVFLFFSAYAVDIIAPKIDLTKLVKNTSGVDIGGSNVTLGQSLTYEISYQNVGNDNVNNFTIKDVLPENIVFNPNTNINYTNSGGATLQSYDPATRTIIFTIPNSSVLVNGALYTIRLNIQVVSNCNMLSDACSNVIMNQAFATYSGIINTNIFEEEGSFASTACKLGSPESTNFLVDISNCIFERTEVLCGASVVLSASDGYASYSWSTSPTGIPVIGTAQTYTATQTGVYYVKNTPSGTCLPINEKITVVPYGNTITNPVIPFADLLPICPNNGKVLPNIFLCGANATRAITTGISDAASIVWQKLNETSCAAVTVDNCANESSACTWNQVGTGPDYTVNTAGQFRVTINYVGGCYSVFYFNVYQNLLSPTVTTRDIICSTLGEITVGGVPAGYEYSLNVAGPYQTSNVFSITTPNSYTVYIKQIGVVTNPCVFTVPDILIRNRAFTVSKFVSQPLCNGDKGAIKLAANDARPQYYFSIHQGGTLVNSVGPIMASEYEFLGLNPGIYTVRVWTEDGCDYSENIEIIEPTLLTATSAVTKPLTCTDGEITVYPVGGTPPYTYYVNSTTDFQSTPQITVTNPLPPGGVYTIDVFDSKNCKTTTTITVAAIPPPVYTVSQTNILCYNDTTGEIKFNVTNANGYTLAYSIDNGVTYVANPTFSNLSAGTYTAILKYSLLGADCFSTADVITITQPTTALTASAGVSELAGCGPLGEGKIRITNPQGGTPFPAPNYYLYSFDNQATWITSNEAYMVPGTYTVYIKDANGCIFAMPNIIIDPKPVEPTIEVEDAVFNCDGTATSTVTITNNGGANYSYQYLLDGTLNANVPSNVFTNVPSGTHTVSVSYKLLSVPTYSNLLKEDFGSGAPTTTSGIASAYCFNDQHVLAPYACGTRSVEDNQYSVASFFWRSDDPTSNNTGAWYHFKDHTSNGTNVNGRYLLVNIGSAAGPYGVLYSKPIVDIIPNQDVKVDLYLANLIRTSRTGAKPDFIIELVDGSGAVVASQATGEIANNEIWNLKSLSLNPRNNTNLTFKIRSGSILYAGNDALIDDITVYQLPKSCVTTKDFTVIIPTDEAFTASITGFKNVTCAGAYNGEITIAAQNFDITKGFQYSINNGVTWFTQMTSPYTITGLADATYNLQIRYDATSTGTCVKSFTQILTAPTALITSATVTQQATCVSGATITASSTGGTLAYRYELWNATGTTNVRPSQNTGVFTNVASGTYIVRGYDANNCTDDADALVVLAPPTLTASLDASSDLCFDSLNQASLVVNVLGGTAPYTYSLDGAPAQNSNTFNNVGIGTHSIIVTDSYGCTAPTVTVAIAPQLTTIASTTKTLDCTGNPNAVILGTISGGNAPFVITVLSGTGLETIEQPTDTTFTYTTAVASTYQFQIQDAQGCITTATATVNPKVNPVITSLLQTQQIFCNGDTTATIKVNIDATQGIGPFTYSIDGTNFQTSNTFTGLAAGAYTVTLKDSNGCTDTKDITINQPTPINVTYHVVNITCNGGISKGSIIIDGVTGGNTAYDYFVTGTNGYNASESNMTGSTSTTFDVVDFGLYQINVVDANGCSFLIQNVLVASPPEDLVIQIDATVDCLVGGTAEITLGGTLTGSGPFYFSLYTGSGQTYSALDPTWIPEDGVGSKHATITGLIPGVTYTFIVYDSSSGCYYYEIADVPIPTNSDLIASNLVPKNITCKGEADGKVSFDITSTYSSSTNVSYEIFNSLSLVSTGVMGYGTIPANGTLSVTDLGNLPFGNYIVVIKEDPGSTNEGCSIVTDRFNITEAAFDLEITASVIQNANCNNDGIINAQAKYGTAPYLFMISTSATPPLADDISWASSSTFNVPAEDYYVYVKDAYGCIKSTTVQTVPLDPSPVIALAPTDNCVDEGNYEITVNVTTAGIAPYSISINNSAFQNISVLPYVVSNLNSGDYTIIVKDLNGCPASDFISIYPPLNLSSAITALPTCADGDGTLTILATGGSGIYEYSIDSGMYQPSANFTGIFAGTHPVTVRDITTNCVKSIPVILAAATPITGFSLSKVDVTCNGGNDGSITATMTTPAVGVNDNPIYRYSIDGGVTTQTSTIFSGLIARTYTVDVISGRSCVSTAPITIGEPASITVPTPTVAKFACTAGTNATNYATITVSGVTGGSGTYANYEFIKGGTVVQFGANNTYIESDLLGGTYTVNVYDNKGCMGTAPATITIAPFIALDKINVAVNNAITCRNLEDITVSVSTIGGTPTSLQYTLVDVSGTIVFTPNSSGVFTGLNIGNYIITVQNLDTGCSIQSVHYVNNPNTFDLTVDSVVDVTCFNGNNGSVNVTFIDRVITGTNPNQSGPFNYTIVDALGNSVTAGTAVTAGPITINTLAAGTYTITATLTNSPFCTVNKNFTITQPTVALAIAETHNAITCVTGNNDGSIAALAVGGWPGGYQFELTGPMTVAYSAQSNFTNLTAGTYTINVRDSKGCVATTTVTLVIPTPITVTANTDITMLSCKGDKNATITVNLPTGGQGSNYLYTLNTTSVTPPTASGPQVSPVFSGLGAGTYTITVTDGYNCSATSAAIVITEPTEVKSNLVVATTQTCLTQTSLTLSATGGTGLYTYSDTATFTTILGSFASSVTFPVPVGTYVYYVKDANGCIATVSNQIKIDPLPALVVNLDKTNAVINCAGDNTGVIVATAQGGLGNYVYTLQDASGNNLTASQASPGVFTQLFAGNYQVKVDSGDCTTTSSIITITQPLAPLAAPYTVTDVTCNGANNGSIVINASGGTGIIKYAISPNLNQFVDDNIFDKLAPGTYDVIVQDVLGCYIKINFTINEPDLISVVTDPASIIPEVCEGDKDGAFSITISGGTAPYSVSLDNPTGIYTTGTATQTDFDFTGLTGGAHIVYIRDNLGCNSEWTVLLPESIRINPIAVIDYSCVNNAASNTVTITVDTSITNPSDVDYSLDGTSYQTSNVFTNVAPGTGHYVDVRHTNGCIQRTASFDIVQVDPLTLILNDGGLNEIVAVATGGAGGYQYTFNGESNGSSNSFIIRESGDYTVTVTDANGCVATANRYFEFIDVCIPNYFTPNGDGVMDGWAPGCTINYKDLTFDIFDRYGRKIATYRLGQYWDGKYNGNELPSGDYWYVLKLNDLKDNREFVGHFTLYR